MGRLVRDYPLGFTARGGIGRIDPIGHAASGRHTGKTNRTRWAALCGAPLARFPRGELFAPLHPRACPKCKKAAL